MRPLASSLIDVVRASVRGLGDLALPQVCAACESRDATTGKLCGDCSVRLLSAVSLRYCPRCGATVGPNVPAAEDGCGSCPTPLPRFERVFRLGPYTEPLRSPICGMKYHRRETMRRPLGGMLAQAVAAQYPADALDLAMPVPMHWQRRLARGYDHARALAQAVAGELDLPVGGELIRTRNTPPQVNLPRSRRIDNIRGAFAVASPADLEGANILLVDDVTTTGATANEASRTLLAAGAARVILAVLAKAEPPRAYREHWGL